MTAGRAHHEIRVLAERHVRALAVDLGGRGDEHELLLLGGVLQHDLGAVHVGLDRVHGVLDDELHPDRRREVEDHVRAIDELGDDPIVENGVDGVLEALPPLEVEDVVDGAGREIVEHQHLVALIEQRLREVSADEARSARNQNSHRES